MKRKKHKIGKTIKSNYSTTKNFWIPIKSVTIEHLKTSHKLFKTIRQPEKFSQGCTAKTSNSSFYSDMLLKVMQVFALLKFWNLLNRSKNWKIMNRQSKKLIYLLSELKSFKFFTTYEMLLMKVILIMFLSHSIVLLYQTHKNLQDTVHVGLLI